MTWHEAQVLCLVTQMIEASTMSFALKQMTMVSQQRTMNLRNFEERPLPTPCQANSILLAPTSDQCMGGFQVRISSPKNHHNPCSAPEVSGHGKRYKFIRT